MKNKILYFSLIATILLFNSCSNEDSLSGIEIESGRKISITASMPEGEPTTRVDLNQNSKNIELIWKVNDEIEVLFVQGPNRLKQKVIVTSTSPDKKTAYFDIIIPAALKTGTYDFYGVYGGNGLLETDPTIAIMPRGPYNANSLNIGSSSIQSRKDVVLFFSYKNIPATSPQKSVDFKHLGSLFNISINDFNPTIASFLASQDINQIRLVGVNNNDKNWAFNSIFCGQYFDMVNNKFLYQENSSNYIYFNPITPGLSGGILNLWGWYPMVGKVWPELKLVMTNSKEEAVIISTNSKLAKTTAPVAGKTYHFYIAHDNTPPPATKFYFSNDTFTALP